MLQIDNLTLRVAGRLLLEGASATVPAGHRVALVGRNGTGKTTLLKLIAGELSPDSGTVSVPTGTRIGWVRQEAPSGPSTLIETVMASDPELVALKRELETCDDPVRLAALHDRLIDIEAHSAESRAARLLAGLGFDAERQRRACADFSGGWRMRVALAGVLFARPDLLLLDEPTNHLDLEATVWLVDYLKSYPGTVLIVSHDRELLNDVPSGILHLDQRRLTGYGGNYDKFVITRAQKLEHVRAQAAKQDSQRQHLSAFVERFRSKASKARQAQSKLKALERLGPRIQVLEDTTTRFDFPSPESLAPPLIALDGVSVGYDGVPVLRRLDLRIDPDDRIALLGANGNGKSTLVKLLAGRLPALAGDVRRPSRLRVGYFAQHQAEELDLAATPIRQLSAAMGPVPEEKVRAHLGRFGLSQAKAETAIGALSGGEKAKLLLAIATREAPHVLMLDEPTNHLDIDSRDALVEALNGYEGAVILISHDPSLVEVTADRLWLVAGGTCRPFDGDLGDYRKLLLETARVAVRSDDGIEAEARETRKDARRRAADLRAKLAPYRKRIGDMEKAISDLGRRKAILEGKLADPDLYRGAPAEVTRLQKEMKTIARDLAEIEAEWLDASLELEQVEAGLSE